MRILHLPITFFTHNFKLFPITFSSFLVCAFLIIATTNMFSQNVVVNPGAGNYPTLQAAFAAINAGTHTGSITVSIINNTTETGTAILNASGSGSASYTTISVQPAGGAARTISGAITGGSPLIDLNGADNVTFDGLNSGGNSLTIENTTASATSNTSTVRFIGGATTNTITRCSILGAFNAAVGTNGGNIFFSTDANTANGNDNNTISNCNIAGSGSNLPTKGIYMNGSTTTTAINNSGNTFSNNNIYNYFGAAVSSAGIYISSGNTDNNITNNKFYQENARTHTSSSQHSAIWISNTSGNNFQISGNIIGFASSTGTGTYSFTGVSSSTFIPVFLSVGSTTATSVQGNVIAGIAISGAMSGTSSSGPFRGIYVSSGLANIGDVTGNTIGSQSINNSITFTSSSTSAADVIAIFNFGSANWITNNNTIGGISVANSSTGAANLYGLRCNTGSTVTWICNNNIIGGTMPNSMQSSSTATGTVVQGILNNNPIGTISNNTVRNLTAAGGTGTTTSASVCGIMHTTSSSNQTFSQNTIYNLTNTNTTAATVVTGIQFNGSTANVVERNLMYNLTTATASTSAEVNGIRVAGGTTIYRNNMIALGVGISNAIGSAATNTSTAGIVGINEASGTNSFFHNTVFIGGSPTTGGGASYAFNGTTTTNTRSFRNNIFQNSRTNSGATGKNYIIKINGTAANPSGLTINNNVYYQNGSGGVFGFFNSLDVANLSAWKTAVGQDASSFEGIPALNDPTNSTPDLHIHPTNLSIAEGNGVDVGVVGDFDGQTRASLTPVDIGADAGNFTGQDLTAPVISYTALANSTNLVSRTTSSFATITDVSGINTTSGTAPRLYFKKSTDLNEFNDNTASTPGWKYVESLTGSSPFDFVINYALLNSSPVVAGDNIQYFVVAQDNAATPNIGINSGTFATNPVSVALTNAAFPIGGTIRSYLISPSYNGVYNVGSGETFATLTGASGFFASINAGVVTGSITLNVTSNLTEDGTNALNQWAEEGSGGYTITIQPNAATERVISGAVALSGMIRLNGADRVTFDGRFAGSGTFLRFRNTNTSNPVFTFLNDATNNTLRYSLVEGSVTSSSSGSIVFSTSTGSTGNSNNLITNCDIRDRSDAAGVPGNAIYSSGSVGAPNASNTISNNNIFNFTAGGVLVTSTGVGNSWTIELNSFYQTSSRSTALNCLSIQGGNGHNILNNSIGGTAPLAGGSNLSTSSTFRGIDLSVGTVAATSVQGNVIKNIRSTVIDFVASYGIFLQAGMANIGTISGNYIGSSNVAERFEINGDSYGIRTTSTSSVNLSNNTINNFGTNATPSTGQYYFGMYVDGTGGNHSVINNTVMNVTNASTPDGTFNTQTTGLAIFATGVQIIRGNTIQNIGNTSTATPTTLNNRVWGILLSSTAVGSIIEKNNVYNIYGSSSGTGARADQVYGIFNQTTSNGTYSNNMVSLNGGSSSSRQIYGIFDFAGATNNYYYNTINIYGTASGTNNTYAFNRNSTSTVNIKNNIFSNERTGGTGFHVAIANTNAAATGWTATSSDYNDLYSTDPSTVAQWLGSLVGNNKDLPSWQAAQPTGSGGDATSFSVLPIFINSPSDLHLTGSNTSMDNTATPIGSVLDDFDSQIRSATRPDIGADEFMSIACVIATGGTISPSSQTTCSGQTVSMTSVGAENSAGISYQWEVSSTGGGVGFNNVSGGSGATTIAYTSSALMSGTFYYRLKVTCSNGPVIGYSNELTVTVNTTPSISLSSNSPVCVGSTLNLNLTTDVGTTFNWSGPNSFASILQNPSISNTTLAASGIYNVTVSTGSCSNTSNTSVIISPKPVLAPTATPANVCSGANSQLNAGVALSTSIKITEVCLNRGGTGGGTYPTFAPGADLIEITNISSSPVDISGWSLSDHASNTTAATHSGFVFPVSTIIPANSVAVVCLGTGTNDLPNRYFNTGGTSDSWLSSSLVGIVLKNGSTVVDAVGCGSGYVFNAGTGVTASDWSGFAPSGSGLAGTTRIAASDTNIGGDWSPSSTTTQTIGVYNAGFTIPVSIASYAWSPATFLSSTTIANPVATAITATTNYSVLVTSTDGCTESANVLVTVDILSATANANNPTICQGANSIVTASPSGGGAPYTYLWNDPLNGTTQMITVTPPTTSTYTVTITDNCSNTTTAQATVTVNQRPMATASNDGPHCEGETLILSGTSDIGISYAWTGPGGFSSTDQNPFIPTSTISNSGTYSMTATSSLGCTSTAATTVVTISQSPSTTSITPSAVVLCPTSPASLLTATGGTISANSLKIGSGLTYVAATSEPTAFCNRWAEYYAQQIYTATELSASGISAGSSISSITFNTNSLGDANSNPNYNIKIGHIGGTSVFPSTSFLNDATYTSVYGPVNHIHTASGDQLIAFTTPFIWDGVSNICIQMSHSGDDNLNNASTQFTAMPDNKTLFYRTSTIGGSSPTGTLSVNRLNIVLGYSKPTKITWTPTTGLYTDAGATIPYIGTETPVVYAKPATTTTYTVTASTEAKITYDGNITESAWGSALATSAGGPAPGFGAGHEVNAAYLQGAPDSISLAIAGNVQNGNRILVFIDSKSGGYNTASFGRTGAPQGIDDFNSSTSFDAGFEADYCLVIGTNGAMDNYFFDLYTLSALGGPNQYLGDINNANIGAAPANSSNTQGFEIAIAKSALGYFGGSLKMFVAYIGDSGFLSNQFLTHAGSGDGNYGSGAVTFGAAEPNPITLTSAQVNNYCTTSATALVSVEGAIVKNSANTGLHSLRSVYNCIAEGGTITYDQPTTSTTVLTGLLDITKSVTIMGASDVNRPEITIATPGINIAATKTLTLQHVDVKSTGTDTFTGSGQVNITGTTVAKQ